MAYLVTRRCRHCGEPFQCMPSPGKQRQYCTIRCRTTHNNQAKAQRAKLRYRNDPTYREAVKVDNLQRYHRRSAS